MEGVFHHITRYVRGRKYKFITVVLFTSLYEENAHQFPDHGVLSNWRVYIISPFKTTIFV